MCSDARTATADRPRAQRTPEEYRAAAERWAEGLARAKGEPFHVDDTLRGWLRVFAGEPGCRAIYAFVGARSGGVYAAKSATKYGHRLGHVFQYAADVATPCFCGSWRAAVQQDREWPSCPVCNAI